MKLIVFLSAIALFLSSPGLVFADVLNLGVLSFDSLIPPPPVPGVNAFDISNLTGNPATSGFALPPEFPSLTPVTFLNSDLTLVGTTSQVITLGNVGPGFLVPGAAFPANDIFSSAEFSATLDPTTFLLAGGESVTATSAVLDVLLTLSSGSALAPGDFALIRVSVAPTAVPEPASWLGLGIVTLWVLRRTASLPRS